MKSASRVAVPPARPLMLYDSDCTFCRLWVRRWQLATGDCVDFAPLQQSDLTQRFPEFPREELEAALHLIEPDGSVYSGAEAALRVLANTTHGHWLFDWYAHSPAFARSSEWAYGLVANHRSFFSTLTRLLWGGRVEPSTYHRARWVFLRALGMIYLVAFLSLWVQVIGLIGDRGILPAKLTMSVVRQQSDAALLARDRFHQVPTLCWISADDQSLKLQCAAGTFLAALLILDIAPALSLFLLWVIYLSLTTVGREFLSFQWDALLLETGFLAVFFAPWKLLPWSGRAPPPSRLALGLLRWLLFRLMLASGCVKLLSGDPTWHNLTALQYHYETQPLPTWIGWYAHQMPAGAQRLSTVLMFGIELVLPFLVFAPRRVRQIPCFGFILLQFLILLTGNYCFFNLLTVALCVLLLDDAALITLVPMKWRPRFAKLAGAGVDPQNSEPNVQGAKFHAGATSSHLPSSIQRLILIPVACVALIVPLLEFVGQFRFHVPLPGPVERLYAWVSPFRSFNSYGLFAVMTTSRREIIVEGSDDGTMWFDYGFKYKPGDLKRRPGFVEPHQPRLDWQMWFAALGDYRQNPWFVNFCVRLLQGAPEVLALLERNPFPQRPPRFIRAQLYEYHFTDLATRRQTGAWWRRELLGGYLPVISLRQETKDL